MDLGCEKPFLDLDPHFYPTLPNTMLSGQYLWDALVKIKCKLQIPVMWVPRSDVVNDRAIMDILVKMARERQGTPTAIPLAQIYQANACRLYLRVTWVSDISAFRGDRIALWAFFGTSRNATDLIYPHQEKPPEAA